MKTVLSYLASIMLFSFIFLLGFLISTIALNADYLAAIFIGPIAITIFGLLSISTYSLVCFLVSRKKLVSKFAANLLTSIPVSMLFSGFFFFTAAWQHGASMFAATFCGAHAASFLFHKLRKTFATVVEQ